MVALKTHARKEANRFIEDVFSSGIRFVLFNEESLLHTKIIGDDLGLDIDWNSCISLSKNSAFCAFINSMGMRVLPAGIEEIKKHLAEEIDNVPLLVSMFSDSTPESVLEMVKLYQQHGEVVAVVGGTLNCRNMAAYQAADVSIGLGVQPCGFCTACSGQRIDFQYSMSTSEEISQAIISTPCSFSLGPNASLYRVMQVIKEARKFMRNIELSILFALSCYMMITADAAVTFVLGWPAPMSIGQYSFVVYLVVPMLAVSFLWKRSSSELMKLLPIKMMHFSLKESGWFIRNHILRVLLGSLGFLICQGLTIGLYADSSDLHFGFQWVETLTYAELKAMQLIQLFWECLWVVWIAPGYLAGTDKVDISLCRNLKWDISTALVSLSTLLAILGYLITCDCSHEMLSVLTNIWPEAIALACWLAGYQILDHFLKKEERRQYQRIQKTMGLYFHTKLGMHSPK